MDARFLGWIEIDYPQTAPIGAITPQMCAYAERNNVIVKTQFNGVTVIAGPTDTPLFVAQKYMAAKQQGKKFALVNSKS